MRVFVECRVYGVWLVVLNVLEAVARAPIVCGPIVVGKLQRGGASQRAQPSTQHEHTNPKSHNAEAQRNPSIQDKRTSRKSEKVPECLCTKESKFDFSRYCMHLCFACALFGNLLEMLALYNFLHAHSLPLCLSPSFSHSLSLSLSLSLPSSPPPHILVAH